MTKDNAAIAAQRTKVQQLANQVHAAKVKLDHMIWGPGGLPTNGQALSRTMANLRRARGPKQVTRTRTLATRTQVIDLFLRVFPFFEEPADTTRQFRERDLECVGGRESETLLLPHVPERAESRETFDATNARSNSGLGNDFQEPEITGGTSMRPTAKLCAAVAKRNDTNLITIFFIEDRYGTRLDGRLIIHLASLTWLVRLDPDIDLVFDLFELGARKRRIMRKIETQSIRPDEGALLHRLLA